MSLTNLELRAKKKKYNIASFNNLKLNYIVMPKCASTSILYQLLRDNGNKPNKLTNNLHSVKIVNYITKLEAINNGYKNFTVLRNPLDRALSSYKDFSLNRFGIGGGGGCKEFNKEFKTIRRKSFYIMYKMVQNYSDVDRGSHFRSQSSWCILDDLIKYNLDSYTIVPRLNVTTNIVNLSTKDEQLIQEIYEEDFKLWELTYDNQH